MTKTVFLICTFLLVQSAIAQTCEDTIPASSPDSRFVVNGEEVTDTETGLIWQRCPVGLTGTDCTSGSANGYNWQQALQAAETKRLNSGQYWRLPNIKELRSIVEEKCYDPAINLAVFPNATPEFTGYWSASPYADNATNAFYVHFRSGYQFGGLKGGSQYVRLVRDAQ